jgi:predicted DNA-binding transcriptional regulator YafY
MERLVRIAASLSANPKYGVPVDKLVSIAGFDPGESGRTQLQREIRHLEKQGWQIENVSGAGTGARYRMVTLDNRLRVRLSLPQAAALQRAALVAKRSDLLARLGLPPGDNPAGAPADLRGAGEGAALNETLAAVRLRAILRFRYKGILRLTHPQSVGQQNGNWYLSAVEGDADEAKTFLVGRMSEVVAVDPGTARRLAVERHLDLHPMRWETDPPVEVMLRTEAAFRPDVVRWLLEPRGEVARDGEVEMRYRVTNRSAFRDRLYELGTRVELLGPAEVRDELLAELTMLAEAGRP